MSSKNVSGGDSSIQDDHSSGRLSEIDDDKFKAVVQANKHSMIRELATALKVSIGSIHGDLKSLGFVKKVDVWVLHKLKKIHRTSGINSPNTKKTIRS